MSTPKQNATPAEMARLANLNQKLYGKNSQNNQARAAEEMARADAIAAKKTNGTPAQGPARPAPTSVRDLRLKQQLAPKIVSATSIKLAQENAARDAEKAKIDTTNKMAATPKTYMPQANTVPNAAMAAEQKMPPPNMVPPANARPMAPTPGGAPAMKRGGSVRNKPAAKFSSGGSTSKASSRGDGIAQRGKTKGRYI